MQMISLALIPLNIMKPETYGLKMFIKKILFFIT